MKHPKHKLVHVQFDPEGVMFQWTGECICGNWHGVAKTKQDLLETFKSQHNKDK